MPATYNKHGVRFQYPENWALDESEINENSVTVYAPGGGFWNLIWRDLTEDPHDLALEALQTLKKEYSETEAEPASETVAGKEISGFDVSFYYVDLVNSATIRGFRTLTASYLILFQAEDRDFRQLEAVFQAITTSLLSS